MSKYKEVTLNKNQEWIREKGVSEKKKKFRKEDSDNNPSIFNVIEDPGFLVLSFPHVGFDLGFRPSWS